jgi:hypothetical protein
VISIEKLVRKNDGPEEVEQIIKKKNINYGEQAKAPLSYYQANVS